MKRIVAVMAVGLVLAGCSEKTSSAQDETEPVLASVKIELRWPLIKDSLTTEAAAADECAGGLDYAEIRSGSQVTFTDQSGKVVGVVDLTPPDPGDNLVVCTWSDSIELDGEPEYVTAEVGGWESKPQKVDDGVVSFHLDTVDEDPEFGSEAQIDSNWVKAD